MVKNMGVYELVDNLKFEVMEGDINVFMIGIKEDVYNCFWEKLVEKENVYNKCILERNEIFVYDVIGGLKCILVIVNVNYDYVILGNVNLDILI